MYRIVPERVEVAAVFGGNRYLVPFNRGIATPVCALARNDSVFLTNTNLSRGNSIGQQAVSAACITGGCVRGNGMRNTNA